jgi:hypothetical protein
VRDLALQGDQVVNWDLALVQCFLCEKYEGTITPHKFCDYIQKNSRAGLQEVLQAASLHPA